MASKLVEGYLKPCSGVKGPSFVVEMQRPEGSVRVRQLKQRERWSADCRERGCSEPAKSARETPTAQAQTLVPGSCSGSGCTGADSILGAGRSDTDGQVCRR